MKRRWSSLILQSVLVTLSMLACQALAAPTIWTGRMITFVRPADVDGTLTANQDCITANVCLARLAIKRLFNGRTESSYAKNVSPAGTEWAFAGLNGNSPSSGAINASNHGNLIFTDFGNALENAVGDNIIGTPGVLHLIADDIYLDIVFTAWGEGTVDNEAGPGNFAYLRSTPALPVPASSPWTLALLGLLLMSSAAAVARRRATRR